MKMVKNAVDYIKREWKYVATFCFMLIAGGVAIANKEPGFAYMIGVFTTLVQCMHTSTFERNRMFEIIDMQDKLIDAYRAQVSADEAIFDALAKQGVLKASNSVSDEEKN
jgi:hypothetical protein